MIGSLRDYLKRRLVPSTVIATSRRRGPARWRMRCRQWLGQPLRVELYFAFDDPYAAIAVPGLARLCSARKVELRLYPLLQRGIADDPAADARALHALQDATRLSRRGGHTGLLRSEPVTADAVAFLAHWCEALAMPADRLRFASAALEALWCDGRSGLQREAFAQLHRQLTGQLPASGDAQGAALARNAQRLRQRGHWESPAACLAGEWFFAHERLAQIAQRLDQYRVGAPA